MSTAGGVLPGWEVGEYGEYAGDDRSPLMPAVRRWLTPVNVAIAVMTLIGLGLRLWQFSRSGSLSGIVEYDDGPYVGSAILLTHGILPYRDYIFVQPPGITLIMFPVALLARVGLIGLPAVMTIGRVLTALVSSAGIALLGLLIRHRGVAAVTLACGLLAVYTDSIAAAHTVLVEPWLTLFCLTGALLVFDRDRLTSNPKRLMWGGVIFGCAGAIEGWAIVPVLVITLFCLPRVRRAARFVAGVAAGFLVPVLPFALASPRGFYAGVITAQIGSRPNAIRVSTLYRFKLMSGLDSLHPWSGYETLLVMLGLVGTVVIAMIVAWLVSGRGPRPLDWFAVLVAAGIVVMFLSPSQFLYHFMGFLGPFLALALALSISRCATVLHEVLPVGRLDWPGGVLTAAVVPVIGVFAVLQANALGSFPPWPVVSPTIESLIPPGSCVLSDTAPILIMTSRLVSDKPGCITMLDSMGADLELSHGLKPDTGAWRVTAVEEMWWRAFRNAQYVLLRINTQVSPRVAWTPALRHYFYTNFKLLYSQNFPVYNSGTFNDLTASFSLYARDGLPGTAGRASVSAGSHSPQHGRHQRGHSGPSGQRAAGGARTSR